MTPAELAAALVPGALVREISTGGNRVFRVLGEDGTVSILKVFATASRERRERHALDALIGIKGVPTILQRDTTEALHWIRMSDGGHWSLGTLPPNPELFHQAGSILRAVHDASSANISNLDTGMDAEWVHSHYFDTLRRLERFRRRLELPAAVLNKALISDPPKAGKTRPSHTRPTPSKFAVSDKGEVVLTDWEWATLAPPEWDLSFALWRTSVEVGDAAAESLHLGYGAHMPDERLRPWVTYHAAMMMLDAANHREGRLGDLSYLVDELARSVA